MIQTMITIYNEKVSKYRHLLDNYMVCFYCEEDCQKHHCTKGNICKFDKMIMDLSFGIYIFLTKQKILFPKERCLEKFTSYLKYEDLVREEKSLVSYINAYH